MKVLFLIALFVSFGAVSNAMAYTKCTFSNEKCQLEHCKNALRWHWYPENNCPKPTICQCYDKGNMALTAADVRGVSYSATPDREVAPQLNVIYPISVLSEISFSTFDPATGEFGMVSAEDLFQAGIDSVSFER